LTHRYRDHLPQLGGNLFLTDGGIETTLIFHEGLELPHFAAFHLLKSAAGQRAIRKYFERYAALARELRVGIVLESATWRASSDWAERLGDTAMELADANRKAIAILEDIRADIEAAGLTAVVSGCVGPRGDGYVPANKMSADEAEEYHSVQIRTFADTAADMVCAMTMNYPEEAIGIARAAAAEKMPSAIAFTVETDGVLPTGESLRAAIERVDDATSGAPAYYMVNCAHPSHFSEILLTGASFVERIRGLRANASRMSHAELNDAPALDEGFPDELGAEYAHLKRALRNLNVMGGCCGTDHRHVEAIARACIQSNDAPFTGV
jgi:S-methylmethionine-dependent homocysteine/selenocysteine methylase